MDRHFILTHGRSGSNFLANTFNQHPNLVNFGEVLGDWSRPYQLYNLICRFRKISWAQFLELLYSSDPLFYLAQWYSLSRGLISERKLKSIKSKSDIKSLGLKDFVFLLDRRGLSDYLAQQTDVKVIYLTRRNHFSRYLSIINMHASGVVKTESGSSSGARYTVDIDDLLDNLKRFREEEDIGDKIIEALPSERVISIDYEEYFDSDESIKNTHARVFNFLAVPPIDVASKQRKILSRDLSDHINNFAEVKNALINAGHGDYLAG